MYSSSYAGFDDEADAVVDADAATAAFRNSSRNARRKILPTFDFGSSLRKYTCRGTL
jgi:hypothetical protein